MAPRMVLIHGDHVAADSAPSRLGDQLEVLLERNPEVLPVLLYHTLSVRQCATLFRRGLFDAIPVPVTETAWAGLLARVQSRSRLVATSQLVLSQSEATSRQLHLHRRRLQDQVAEVGEQLIAAQHDLKEANRELSDHMAQLSLLYQFGRELSAAENWDATLKNILEHLAQFIGAEGAALILRSAPGGSYSPRQTYQWEETAWDRVLVSLEDKISSKVAEGLLAPGIFRLEAEAENRDLPSRRIIALPLEHQGLRLGYLLLLDRDHRHRESSTNNQLPFLQAVQVILAEEVAGAQMLDRLREIGSFNARVLETVRSGIWVLDEQGRTIYCNRTARSILTGKSDVTGPVALNIQPGIGRGRGCESKRIQTRAPVPSELLREVEHPELFLDGLLRLDDLQGVLFSQLWALEDTPFRGEGRVVRADGEAVPVLVQTSLMAGRGHGEQWLVVVAEDLREGKKLEAERVRADRLEGLVEMSATLAHEIRNPLMGLSAQAELLADQLPAGDERARYIDVITSEVERINDTINRLLNFVRPYEPQLDAADLLRLAYDCLDLVRPKASEKQVALQLELEPAAAEATAWLQQLDGGQIKQVLLNLLINAVDASPESGTVYLRLQRAGAMELTDGRSGTSQLTAGTVLEVTDSGAGFQPADHEKIFRPFFTTKSTGTGLGLSICRKIVAAHGGEIEAEREGNRTRFRVLLPEAFPGHETRHRQEVS
ncbi:MAG: ATP-binding protein [bacterium]